MAFGQQSGPPASAKQVAYLLSLLKQAGYETFRDARHPFELTQRQAGGKFSTREASALIDRLLGNEPEQEPLDLGARPLVPVADALGAADLPASDDPQTDAQALLVRGVPADVLADELRRRGWTVTAP